MDQQNDKTTKGLNKVLLLLTIVSVSFTIIQNLDSVKKTLGFKTEPSWEGAWEMEIGSAIVGKTQTILREENGKLIGAYVIYGPNNSVFVTQMVGIIKEDNVYKGEWFQFSDSIFQAQGKFNLVLSHNDTFKGTFSKKKRDGSFINDLDWKGKRIDKPSFGLTK